MTSVCKKCGEFRDSDGHSCVERLKAAVERQRRHKEEALQRAAQAEAQFVGVCEQRDALKKVADEADTRACLQENRCADLVLTLRDTREDYWKIEKRFEEFVSSTRWVAGTLFVLAMIGWLVAVLR